MSSNKRPLALFALAWLAWLGAFLYLRHRFDPLARIRQIIKNRPEGRALRFDPINQRISKLALALERPRPQLAVFGSSRAFPFEAGHFGLGPGDFFNVATSAASLETDLAYWQVLKEEGKLPRRIFLQFDLWVLNEAVGWHQEDRLLAPLLRFLAHSAQPRFSAEVGIRALEAQLGLGALLDDISNSRTLDASHPYRKPGEFLSDPDLLLEDGTFDQAITHRLPLPRAEVMKEAPLILKRGAYSMKDWKLSARRCALLRAWLLDAKARGCEVWVGYLPLLPWTLDSIEQTAPGAFEQVDKVLTGLSQEGLIQALSLARTAAELGCGEADYFDTNHAGPRCLGLLARRLSTLGGGHAL